MDVPPEPEQDLGWRLASVESRLDAISERLGRLELTLRDGITEDVHDATAELRRAISELGRRLVQDLPSELARHRDAIVSELRPPPPAPAPEPEPEPPTVEPPTIEPPTVDGGLHEAGAAGDEGTEAAERRRASRRRRRQG